MSEFIRNNKVTLAGLAIGAASGFLYYYFVGCMSGTCPITSRPLNSTIYGTIMGLLLFNSFQKNPKK